MNKLIKVAIIGPESTGKSTLTAALAQHYQTCWVSEYARSYIGALNRDYVKDDLLQIAKGQVASEEMMAKNTINNLLFCDTDLYVIKVWSEFKYKDCHPWILQQIAWQEYDLYLLTYIDIPWTEDPQREHPEPKMREYFYHIYKDLVIHSGVPWTDIRGTLDQRLKGAIRAIDDL